METKNGCKIYLLNPFGNQRNLHSHNAHPCFHSNPILSSKRTRFPDCIQMDFHPIGEPLAHIFRRIERLDWILRMSLRNKMRLLVVVWTRACINYMSRQNLCNILTKQTFDFCDIQGATFPKVNTFLAITMFWSEPTKSPFWTTKVVTIGITLCWTSII